MKSNASVLFLGKSNDEHCRFALAFCRENFADVQSFCGEWGEPLPERAASWRGDYIVSYLSRWVVPQRLLDRATRAAINFHPATPEFPGIGCVNFALYTGAKEYGATCHHMAAKVDTGSIIEVRRIPVFETDNVESLLNRTYQAQFDLFLKIGWMMRCGEPLPESAERWTRAPYTRKEFDALNQITPDMTQEEESLRIRSCAFGKYFPRRVALAA